MELLIFFLEVWFSGTWSGFLSVPTDTLVMMGGKVAGLIAAGEYWRLVTPVVLHAGIMHVTINIFVQCMFGIQLEREWGAAQVALIYREAPSSIPSFFLLWPPFLLWPRECQRPLPCDVRRLPPLRSHSQSQLIHGNSGEHP